MIRAVLRGHVFDLYDFSRVRSHSWAESACGRHYIESRDLIASAICIFGPEYKIKIITINIITAK